MNVKEYFDDLIKNYDFGEHICVSCKTGLRLEDMSGLDDCDDYDDFDEDELKEKYQESFDDFFESNDYILSEKNCPCCGHNWCYKKETEDSEYEKDYFCAGNHIQVLKEGIKCSICNGTTTTKKNGYTICKCGNIF